MAIRFDKKFNAEIRREIDKVNKKFARARKLGYDKVPRNIRISEIKEQFSSRFATRRELRRQLAAYKRADIQDLSKTVELETGGRVSLYTLKVAQQKNTRLLRRVNRDIKKREARISAEEDNLPFGDTELDRLYNVQAMLKEGVRKSESNLRRVNELYAREFSSLKKDAFQDAFYNTIEEQIKFSDLSRSQKQALLTKIRNMDIDTLIDANKNDDTMAEILDRYKNKNEYNERDKKVLASVFDDLYQNIDSIIEEYSV